MTIDEFWALIAKVDRTALRDGQEDKAIAPLTVALATQTEADMEAFEEHLARALYDLDTRAHADSSGESGNSDDGFLYARCYVVAQGREHYEKVLADPAAMPKTLEEWCEPLLFVGAKAWAELTGGDMDSWCPETSVSYESGSNPASD
jgi:Protein of unknown function (DUF4240)